MLARSLPAQQRDIIVILTDDQPWQTLQYMPRTKGLAASQEVDMAV
jgi:hypothetical protein